MELNELKRKLLTPGRVPELYDVGDVLGKGGFATVRVGKERREPGRVVAIKIVNPKISADPKQQLVILEEVATMVRVNAIKNGNLLRFVAAHEDFSTTTQSNRMTIVSELCSGGELFDRIVKVGHYDEKKAASLVAKLAAALDSLHKHKIIHRDIKPENILYASPSDDAEPVIADFGLAKAMDAHDSAPAALVGTPGYLSPEIIRERKYTPACDVWALGVILYILLCGYPPFYAEDNKQLYAQICKGIFTFHDDAWAHVSPEAKDLVRKMLTVDPRQRITMAGMLAHPWVAACNVPGPAGAHLASTLSNLRKFNARRKIKAAVMAAAWLGGVRKEANSALATLLGARVFSRAETDALGAAFRKVAGPSGKVNLEQFKRVMAAELAAATTTRAEPPAAGLPLDRMFALFDKDGSGDIDLREYLTSLACLRAAVGSSSSSSGAGSGAPDWRATLKLIFDIYDGDGSGYLSLGELVELLLVSGLQMLTPAGDAEGEEKEAAGAGAGAGSGAGAAGSSSGGTTPLHLSSASVVNEGRAEAIANIFTRMDTNRDGKVSFDEFLGALEGEPAIKQAILAPLTALTAAAAVGAAATTTMHGHGSGR